MNENSTTSLFDELAQAIRLREGVEGISRAMWLIHQKQARSTHEWSRQLRIPVPVLSALRRELEKREILVADSLEVSESGKTTLNRIFGQGDSVSTVCPTCTGIGSIIPPQLTPALEELREMSEERPKADMSLDQSHGTAETALRRALLLYEHGLLGQSLLFVGDDDYVSIACLVARKHLFHTTDELGLMTVLDIDPRYLDTISAHSDERIETLDYDVRTPLPRELHGRYDAAITDPAYTTNALLAFSIRCAEATHSDGSLLLSMPMPDSAEWGGILHQWLQQGWVIREIHAQMNEYIGASIHAHRSSAMWLQKIAPFSPETEHELRYTPFYTGDRRPAGGLYRCTVCDTEHVVGPGEEFSTIAELKTARCHECDNDTFSRKGPRTQTEDNSL